MIDARTHEADYDDTVLHSHVHDVVNATLFTALDDDGDYVTYARVPRSFAPADVVVDGDDDVASPWLVYYADVATTVFLPIADFARFID